MGATGLSSGHGVRTRAPGMTLELEFPKGGGSKGSSCCLNKARCDTEQLYQAFASLVVVRCMPSTDLHSYRHNQSI